VGHFAHYAFHSAGALIGAVLGYFLLADEHSCTTSPGSFVPGCTTVIGVGSTEPLAAIGIGAIAGLIIGELLDR